MNAAHQAVLSRAGIRLYFAAKASIETAWLAGLLLWLFFAAYPAFYSLESRVASIIGMIALIGAIAISGYIAAIAKPKKLQSIFSIGTAIASMAFYYLANVISFYAWINGGSFYYDLLPTSGVGFGYNQFDINYMVALAGFGVNAAVAAISALTMNREKYSAKVVAGLAIGIPVALVVLMRTIA